MPMNPVIGAGLIAGAGSVVGSAVGGIFGNKMIDQQIQGQKELADYTSKLNYKQWQDQMRNGASLQVQGLRQAGLNPAMINGVPDVGSINSPQLGSITPTMPDYGGMISGSANSIANQILLPEQKNLLRSQTEKNLSESGKTNQETYQLKDSWESVKGNLDNQFKLSNFELTQLKPQQLDLYKKQVADFDVKWQQMQAQTEEIMQHIENLKSEKGLTDQQKSNLEQELKLYPFKLANILSSTSANYASAYASRKAGEQSSALATLAYQQRETEFQKGLLAKYQADSQKVDALNRQFELTVKKNLGENYHSTMTVIRDFIGLGGEVVGSAGRIMDVVNRGKALNRPAQSPSYGHTIQVPY